MTDHTRCMRPSSLVDRDATDDQHYVWDGDGYLPVTAIQRGFYEETYVESQQEYGCNPSTPGQGVDLAREYMRVLDEVASYDDWSDVPKRWTLKERLIREEIVDERTD